MTKGSSPMLGHGHAAVAAGRDVDDLIGEVDAADRDRGPVGRQPRANGESIDVNDCRYRLWKSGPVQTVGRGGSETGCSSGTVTRQAKYSSGMPPRTSAKRGTQWKVIVSAGKSQTAVPWHRPRLLPPLPVAQPSRGAPIKGATIGHGEDHPTHDGESPAQVNGEVVAVALATQYDLCDDTDSEHDEHERAQQLGKQFTPQGIRLMALVVPHTRAPEKK